MELGVIPGASDSGGYLELGGSSQGGSRLFRKHLLTIGKQFLHPKTGRPITLGEDAWRAMKSSFDSKRIIQQPVFTLANDKNEHVENPLAVAGLVTALERDGDRVMATLDVKDPAVAERIADGRLPGASAFLALDAKDPQSGERCGAALLHVCGTLRPALVDLAPYEPVAAMCGPAFTELPDGSVCPPTLLMLCQSEVDPVPVMLAGDDPEPDYQHEPGCYYERPAVHDEDFLRAEAARLGLLAYQESRPGPGIRPEYAGVITDFDRQAALSAEAEISDADIIEAAAELAMACRVSPDSVHMMCHDAHQRSGLGRSELERARVLGEVQVALSRGQLEVSDEQVLALSQLYDGAGEVLRLTAEPDLEDMFTGLAHPSRSGKLVTTKTRAHVRDTDDEDPVDHDQPARGGEVHKKLRRIFERNPDLFTDGTGHEGPKSPKSRQRSQAAIRARGPGVRPPD